MFEKVLSMLTQGGTTKVAPPRLARAADALFAASAAKTEHERLVLGYELIAELVLEVGREDPSLVEPGSLCMNVAQSEGRLDVLRKSLEYLYYKLDQAGPSREARSQVMLEALAPKRARELRDRR